MRHTLSILSVVFCLFFSGCYQPVRLYPVTPPAPGQTAGAALDGKVTGLFNSGNMTVKLPSGEVCSGHWAVTAPAGPTSDLAGVWDAIYGPGFYVAHVIGERLFTRAVLTGDKGTAITAEMYKPEHAGPDNVIVVGQIRGVAQDNKGTIYKLTM
jgi:hypothetical protein